LKLPGELQLTTKDLDRFSNKKARRFSANIFLNREKLRSTSVEDIGAYLKYTKSLLERSSGILFVEVFSPVIISDIFDNCRNPSFFSITFLNLLYISTPFVQDTSLNLFSIFSTILMESANGRHCFSELLIVVFNLSNK